MNQDEQAKNKQECDKAHGKLEEYALDKVDWFSARLMKSETGWIPVEEFADNLSNGSEKVGKLIHTVSSNMKNNCPVKKFGSQGCEACKIHSVGLLNKMAEIADENIFESKNENGK